MKKLAEEHAKKLSESNAYKLSAKNDKFQLENGGFFDSKLYNVKYNSTHEEGKDDSNRSVELNGTSEIVDSLTSEMAIRQQEERVMEMEKSSPHKRKDGLDELPELHFEKASKTGKSAGGLQYRGVGEVSAKDFLDNWLSSEEKLHSILGKKLSPHQVSLENHGDIDRSFSHRKLSSETLHDSDKASQHSVGEVSIKSSAGTPTYTPLGKDKSESKWENVARSRSADHQKSNRNSPHRMLVKSREGLPPERERKVNSSEYVYQQKFVPRRLRQQPLPSPSSMQHPYRNDPGRNVRHQNGDMPPPQDAYGPQQEQFYGYHHQQPPGSIAHLHPYYHPPGSHVHQPFVSPPYPHHPFHQAQQIYPYPHVPMPHQQPHPYIPHNQMQPPVSHPPVQSSHPSAVDDPFLSEMDKLQKLIEMENEKLLNSAMIPDVIKNNKVQSPAKIDNEYKNGTDAQHSSRDNQPRRRNRAELKHHYEMEAIKHDMEKIRQVNALEELKVQLEREKEIKRAEMEHQQWLDDQKRIMQSLKIKQAVLAEEGNFKRTENAIRNSLQHDVVRTPVEKVSSEKREDEIKVSHSKNNLKRTESSAPLKYIDRLSVSVDGVTILPGAILGDEFRIIVSLFECKAKKALGRAQQSEWETWDKHRSQAKPGVTYFLKDSITKTLPSKMYSKHRNAEKSNSMSELELSQDKGNFVKVLVDVQGKEANQPHKSVGWIVFDLPLVTSKQGLPATDEKDVKVSLGAWRMKGRSGLKDAFGGQKSTKADGVDMWVLFRINTPQEARISSLKGEYLTSDEIMQRYEPLDGEFGIHPAESRNNPFSKVHKVSPALSAINSFKSYSEKMSRKTPSVASRSSKRSIQSAKSIKSEASKTPSNVLEALQSADSDDDDDAKKSIRSGSKSNISSKRSSRVTTSRRSRSESSGSRSRSSSSGSRSSSMSTGSSSRSSSRSGSSRSTTSSDNSVGDNSQLDKDDPMSKFWTLGTPTRPCDCKYQKGDGIDIYVDSAMFLPDNCTVTRVVVKLMTSDYEVIGEVHEAFSMANEGSNISPVYNFKIECRRDVFNLTLTALIRIDTMDSVSLETVGVGYAAVKVFSTLNREQPTSPKQPDVYINTGLFQLPVRGGRLKKGNLLSEKSLAELGLPMLPCASLLVRIYAAPKAPDGLLVLSRSDFPRDDWVRNKVDIPAPSTGYLGGNYDGSECEPTSPFEISAFEAKACLPTKTVENACSEAVSAKPLSSLRGHVHPRPDNASPAEVVQWLQSLLVASNSTRGILDYALSVPYSFEGGISFTVERLYKMPSLGMFSSSDILYKVIYSTSPPGLLYKDPPLAEGVYFTANTKLSSHLHSPEYEDGAVVFHPTNIEQNLCVIFDVRLLNLEHNKSSSEYKLKVDANTNPNKSKDKKYWTIFPLGAETVLKGGYTHIQSGVFQLPLFEGSVPHFILDSLNPMRQILDILSGKKSSITICESGASVLFKCLNPCLGKVMEETQSKWMDHVSTTYLDSILQAARTGNSNVKTDNFSYVHDEYMGNVKTVAKQFAKGGIDIKKMLKDINKQFASAYDLKYDE